MPPRPRASGWKKEASIHRPFPTTCAPTHTLGKLFEPPALLCRLKRAGVRFSGDFGGSFNPKALANLRACALHKARTRSCFVWLPRLRKNS